MHTSKTQFYKLIKNPVYCGLIYIPAFKNEGESLVKGNHEPLITEELFDLVQSIIFKKQKKVGYKTCAKPELPLRGFIKCARCGRNLTGSASKGGSGIRHFYYHCSKGCKERVPAVKVNLKFSDILNSLEFKSEVKELYFKIIEKLFGSNLQEQEDAKSQNERLIEKYESQLKNMRLKMANNEITSSDYNEFKNDIIPILQELKDKNIDVSDVETELKKYLTKGLSLIKNISKIYDFAPLDGKQKIIRSIFKENMTFSENQVRTGKLNDVVDLICSNSNSFEDKKNKTEDKINLQSYVVARTGIEPVFRP